MTDQIKDLLNPTPDEVRVWGYDTDLSLMSQDEDLIFHDIKYIPILVELAADPSCPKQDYAYHILCNFCRDKILRGGMDYMRRIESTIRTADIPSADLPRKWYAYVNRLLQYTCKPKPVNQSEASYIANELLVGSGRYGTLASATSPKDGWLRFTFTTGLVECVDICLATGEYVYRMGIHKDFEG